MCRHDELECRSLAAVLAEIGEHPVNFACRRCRVPAFIGGNLKTQFLVLLFARASASLLQLIATVVLARSITVSSFGYANVIINLALVASVMFDFGLSSLAAKYTAQNDRPRLSAVIHWSFISSLYGGLLLTLGTLTASLVLDFHSVYSALALAISIERHIDTVLMMDVASGGRVHSAISFILRRTLSLVLFLSFLGMHFGAESAFSLSWLAGAAAGLWHSSRVGGGRARHLALFPVVPLLRDAVPFLINNVAAQSRLLDTAIVSVVTSPNAAGGYAAAGRLVQPFMLITNTLATVILPRAIGGRRSEALRLGKLLLLAAAAAVALAFTARDMATPLITAVLGSNYSNAGPVLTWILAGLPLVSVAGPLAALLQGRGRERFVAANSATFAIVTAIAVAVGAFLGGAVGGAIGLFVAYALKVGSLGLELRQVR